MPVHRPILFGLAGWSGSGKSTIAEQLITLFSQLGPSVGTIKHAHYEFDADVKGKDSWRHRKAGAGQGQRNCKAGTLPRRCDGVCQGQCQARAHVHCKDNASEAQG